MLLVLIHMVSNTGRDKLSLLSAGLQILNPQGQHSGACPSQQDLLDMDIITGSSPL